MCLPKHHQAQRQVALLSSVCLQVEVLKAWLQKDPSNLSKSHSWPCLELEMGLKTSRGPVQPELPSDSRPVTSRRSPWTCRKMLSSSQSLNMFQDGFISRGNVCTHCWGQKLSESKAGGPAIRLGVAEVLCHGAWPGDGSSHSTDSLPHTNSTPRAAMNQELWKSMWWEEKGSARDLRKPQIQQGPILQHQHWWHWDRQGQSLLLQGMAAVLKMGCPKSRRKQESPFWKGFCHEHKYQNTFLYRSDPQLEGLDVQCSPQQALPHSPACEQKPRSRAVGGKKKKKKIEVKALST